VRNVAGVSTKSDVMVLAFKHLKGPALQTHLQIPRAAGTDNATHYMNWVQTMSTTFPGPTASQRQNLYLKTRWTADLGTAQAWCLECARVMTLIPGLPEPTDGPAYRVALVAKFVAGLPATVRNFVETVRGISDDPTPCSEITDVVQVAEGMFAYMTGEQLASESEKPATVANITDNDGEHCATEFCPAPTSHTTADCRCRWWQVKHRLDGVTARIQKNADEGRLYKKRKIGNGNFWSYANNSSNNNTNSGYHTNNFNRSGYNNRFNGPRNDLRGNIQDDKTDAMAYLRNHLKNMSDAVSRIQGENSKN
jgi:hypothetical protein